MSDRFAEKARQRKRRLIWRWVVAILVVLLGVLLVWVIWFSDALVVRQVKVTGTEHLTAAQVRAAAKVPRDVPLPRLDTDAIAERVGDVREVESVEVDRSLPHTVVIDVTERSAVAWVDRDGVPWAVDGTGVVYRPLKSEPSHLPKLDVALDDRRTVAAAARVADDIGSSATGLRKDVQLISAESPDSIELDLTEGRTVVWGSAEQATAKLTVLEPLLKISARTYDVSAPERPTTVE